MRHFILGTMLLLSACTTMIGNPPIDGWPKLSVEWHRVSGKQMMDFCVRTNADNPLVKINGLLVYIMGCAEPDFDRMACEIYVDKDFPDAGLDEHELKHCEGWDHYGETGMRDLWMEWQKSQP